MTAGFFENPAVCITGTDTDAGKTFAAAALLRAAASLGFETQGIKPVQTGCAVSGAGELAAPDISVYLEACPEARVECFARMKTASSPHLAAKLEGGAALFDQLNARSLASKISRSLQDAHPRTFSIIEAAGGLMAPLNGRETMLDLFKTVNLPVLLVVANRLGAINHALLSLAALERAGVTVAGFIAVTPKRPDLETKAILADNPSAIARMSGIPCLAELPFIPELAADDSRERAFGWDRAAKFLLPVVKRLSGPGQEAEEASELLRFDREHIWHPYTSATKPLPVRLAVSTNGARIKLADGRNLVDGMSSWWCAIHGYNHPELLAALKEQADRMPHVMFGGLTHKPAVELARKLVDLTPRGLEQVFLCDSGSVAVEVAVKMAVQYQHAGGRPERSAIMTIQGGYHGDTLGAMSVCDPVTGMHTLFSGILPKQVFAPRPSCRFDAPYNPGSALAFERVLKENAARVAAVILEPIVQGAGGMWFYHPDFLRRVRDLCSEYGCLLIVDEIATGFGRTGKLFACEWAGIRPDIMCLGKALTGGVMTLAATLATARVAGGISQNGGVLMHGPTFMANPLACAVACKSLDLLGGGWEEKVGHLERGLSEGLQPCLGLPGVADVRVLGAIGVLEMERPVNVEKAQNFLVEECGVWLRPFGKNIYTMPPYIVSNAELEKITGAMQRIVLEGQWA